MSSTGIAAGKDALEPLELVGSFVNTKRLSKHRDELEETGSLRDWLAEHGLMDVAEPVSEGDLRRAHDVREGLRALLLANNGEPLDRAAVERLDRAARR